MMKLKQALCLVLLLFVCSSKASDSSLFFTSLIDYSSVYKGETAGNALRTRSDIDAVIDLERFLPKESYLQASYSLFRGDNGQALTGDIQAFSNLDTDHYSHLMDFYLSTTVFSATQLKVGYMDLTDDFLAPEQGGGFINASEGFSPTVLNLSTYPLPKLGLFIGSSLSERVYIKLGVYAASEHRTSFSSYFAISELSFEVNEQSTLRVGVWHATDSEENSLENHSLQDIYAVFEHRFNDSLSGFMQYGQLDDPVAEVSKHKAIGVVWQPNWYPDDSLGMLISQAQVQSARQETAVEWYYDFKVNEHVLLKPGVVVIHQPSGDADLKTVQLFNLRIELTW